MKRTTNTTLWVVAGVCLVIGVLIGTAILALAKPQQATYLKQTAPSLTASGDVQQATLTVQNGKYIMQPATLVAGVPVRMTVDTNAVYGCARSIRIPAFGVAANVAEGRNVIEFTPTKAGTFNIQCSMNMFRGTFLVSEKDGSISTFQEPAATGGGSCGASGGGCGCGGGNFRA